jgi:hypothetical protein
MFWYYFVMDRLDFKIRKRLEIQPPGARVNSAMAG